MVGYEVTLDLNQTLACGAVFAHKRPRCDGYSFHSAGDAKVESLAVDPLRLDAEIVKRQRTLCFL